MALPITGPIPLRTRTARRTVVLPGRAESQVWPARFAYAAAGVILGGFTVLALPLWIALYRLATAPTVVLGDLLPVGMLLLGGLLCAATAWVVVVELRARLRVVDVLGRTGEHEAPGSAPVPASFLHLPGKIALLVATLTLFAGAIILAL